MKTVLMFASAVLVLASVVPLVRQDRWWIRIFDFPRAQVAGAGVVMILAWVPFWDRADPVESATLFLLAVAVVYQGYRMYPYTPMTHHQVRKASSPRRDMSVRLLISNVLVTNRDKRLLAEIERTDPDLILCVECDEWWERQLRPLERSHPFTVREVRDDAYGMLFLSRFEPREMEIRHIRRAHIPSVHARIELPSGVEFAFHGLHPDPPYPRYADDTTQRDAEVLLVGQDIRRRGGPTIVAGDLNDVAWSHTTHLFQKISGMLDPRIGRRPMCTFPVGFPPIAFPLDHVFVSSHFKLVSFERMPSIGSDHYPVFIDVEYRPQPDFEGQRPRASESDVREAREKIWHANVARLAETRQGRRRPRAGAAPPETGCTPPGWTPR